MNIIHRLSLNAHQAGEQTETLARLQVRYDFAPLIATSGVVSFEVTEGTQLWENIQEFVIAWKCCDLVRTEFTKQECELARYLVIRPKWIHGYPMPDNDFGYLQSTYGGSGCHLCGSRRVQIAPFRMRSEPKWKARSVLELNWVPDELFIRSDVFNATFQPLGFSCSEVLHHRTDLPFQSVLQLRIKAVATESLLFDESTSVCSQCRTARHSAHMKGFFPSYSEVPASEPIFRTKEVFGEGGISWREIIVTQEVYRLLSSGNIGPLDFYPLSNG